MLYHLYELSHAAISPARAAASSTRFLLRNPFNPLSYTHLGRNAAAAAELLERTTRRYKKPEFGIGDTLVKGRRVGVRQETVWRKPFCSLLHFRKEFAGGASQNEPHVLIVAPMSGHYATLLRGTVEAMLPFADVYITDWHDAKLVPAEAGGFDLDDYIDYVIEMIELFHGDVHVMGVCQPAVPVLSAVALMETRGNPSVPRSLILKGGPIDTRVNPTAVNRLAEERGIDWFRNTVITDVPWPHRGHGRRVYPGFLQLGGFLAMNLDRHVEAHKELFFNLVRGDGDSVEKHKDFYDEYLAVMDLPAEFYLQTVDQVFVRHLLPKAEMFHRGELIDLTAIVRVPIMTVEGEKDDITGVGQCEAALALCSSLPRSKKRHYVQPGVGHYGIFNGSRYRHEIVPRVVAFISDNDVRGGSLKWLMRRLSGDNGIAASPRPLPLASATVIDTEEGASPPRASSLPSKRTHPLARLSGTKNRGLGSRPRAR